MTGRAPRFRRIATLIALVAAVALISACSFDDSIEPDPTATPTAVAFEPGDIAVGSLIDTSREAWGTVETWTSESRDASAAADSGTATTSTTSETLQGPDARHVVSMNGDTVVAEEIVLDGRIYMRGTMVSSSVYPDVNADAWISFTPDQVPEGSVLEQRVAYLTAPPEFPFATVTDETRALPAKPSGEVRVDDRTCTAYRFTTTTPESEGIDYTIAFDDQDRPCQLVREGGGVVETTSWSYPEHPEPLEPPKEVTPVETFPGSGA
jgi:hypothetical protein